MIDEVGPDGLSRRALLQRGAAVTGLAWAAPVVQSMSSHAYAAGSHPHHGACTAKFSVRYQVPTKVHAFGVWSVGDGSSGYESPGHDASSKHQVVGTGHVLRGMVVSTAAVGGVGPITAVYDRKRHCVTLTAPGSCRLYQASVKLGGRVVRVRLAAPYPQTKVFAGAAKGARLSVVSVVLCCN